MQSLVFQSRVNHSEERISCMLYAVRPKYKKSYVKNKITKSLVKVVTEKNGYINNCLVRNVEGSRKFSEGLFVKGSFHLKIYGMLF